MRIAALPKMYFQAIAALPKMYSWLSSVHCRAGFVGKQVHLQGGFVGEQVYYRGECIGKQGCVYGRSHRITRPSPSKDCCYPKEALPSRAGLLSVEVMVHNLSHATKPKAEKWRPIIAQ
jgi:hypothetical protein